MVNKDKKQAKRTEEEKEEGRRQKYSSRKQGPENKTDQTRPDQIKQRKEQKAAEQEEDPGRQL